MQHPFPKQGLIKATMERISKVRPGGTCANLPVRGNWCSFKSGKMFQNVREFESETWVAMIEMINIYLTTLRNSVGI